MRPDDRYRLFLCGDGKGKDLPTSPRRMPRCQFGENLTRARKEMGWTKADVAEFTGIPTSNLGAIERGEVSPCLDVVVKLCALLGADIGDMVSMD